MKFTMTEFSADPDRGLPHAGGDFDLGRLLTAGWLAWLRGLAAVAISLAALGSATAQTAPTVNVDGGRIAGKVLDTDLHAYLGVPYAAPPVRELRWRPPQPVLPWSGVLNADRFGPQCTQPLRDSTTNHYAGPETTSEDCLTLNVWAKPGLSKAPVIVYLHGGAFFIGASSMPVYQGEAVARQGAVFVSMNYRLGVLGFLAHPALSRESSTQSSGNYGWLDQIAALQWVQHNIEKFGGDPAKVTVMGQSAGSMSILALQASPLAKGLFSRAVGFSGAMMEDAGAMAPRRLPAAESDGLRYQTQVNAQSIDDLRRMPADRLVASRAPGAPAIGPVVDGYVLPTSIAATFARGQQNDMPLLLGYTRDEALGGLGSVRNLEEFRSKAQAQFGARAAQFLQFYPAQSDAEASAQARAADRDATMTRHMLAWATAQARYGRMPVYTTMFARPHSYAPGVVFADLNPITAGAYHTSEMPFWLGTLDAFNRFRTTRNWTREDRQLSANLVETLVAFARSGVPATAALSLPRFDPAAPQLLEVGELTRVAPWPEERRLNFFAQSAATPPATPAARD
jgi:para-nitrobenzyl esterase